MNKKAIIIGDLHFGVSNGNKEILEIQLSYFENQVFPYMKENDITAIFQLGDFTDNRVSTDTYVLNQIDERIFQYSQDNNIEWHILIGNHDIYHKSNLNTTVLNLFERAYGNENIFLTSQKTVLHFDKNKIQMQPWLLPNEQLVVDKGVDVVLGHFEMKDFHVSRTYKATHGLDPATLPKDIPILSGHYHGKQKKGNIFYIGTPIQLNWSDYEEEKGFYVYEGNWSDLTFIENNEFKHLKVYLDVDTKEIEVNGFKELLQLKYKKNMDLSMFNNNKVKVYVRKELAIVKSFIENLKEVAYSVDLEIVKETEELDVEEIVSRVKGYDIEESIVEVVEESDRELLQESLIEAKMLMKG